MRHNEFVSICKSALCGKKSFVKNDRLGYPGEVVSCTHEVFMVKAFDHQYRWSRDACSQSHGELPLGPPSDR